MKKNLFYFLLPIMLLSCSKDNSDDQAAIDKAILLQYIADHSLLADSTASGLYYVISEAGSGVTPHSNSLISVHYKGSFTNDHIFEQTSGSPAEGFLRQFIAGWQEGIPKIKKGGKIKLLIPSALAYGKNGYSTIPGNTSLIFDIELVDVQ